MEYEEFAAPVQGGLLAGGVWNPASTESAPVLAVHGITASHLAWPLVAERIGGLRMIAPDLRGRGRSNTLTAPWGIRDHADDLARVLDHFSVERAVIAGHSMGAFVAVRLAAQHPDRVSSVVLVDGGLPLPKLEGVPAADLPSKLLGPAGERLKQRYESRSSYEELWRQHPAFIGQWNDAVANYVDYDLDETVITESGSSKTVFTPSARYAAVAANIVQMSGDDGYRRALAGLSVPATFLRAPRGLLNEARALYSREQVEAAAAVAPHLDALEADDVNHYTIVMTPHGAEQVAPLVVAAAARVSA